MAIKEKIKFIYPIKNAVCVYQYIFKFGKFKEDKFTSLVYCFGIVATQIFLSSNVTLHF